MEKFLESEYKIIKPADRYKNSVIYYALENDSKVYAIKVVDKLRSRELEILKKELPSSCIKLLNHFQYGNEHAMVFPYYPSTIYQTFLNIRDSIPIRVFKKWCLQIASTINKLHEIGIIHADIKPENILLTEGIETFEQADCVICDFGISAIENLHYSIPQSGSHFYKPKEVDHGETPNSASDVYSIGRLMLFMILKNDFPEYVKDASNLTNIMIKKQIIERYPDPNESQKLAELICNCIESEREHRITLEDYLNHSFFDDCSKNYYENLLGPDPQDNLQSKFTDIEKTYTKFFLILVSTYNTNLTKVMNEWFILSLLVKHLAKQCGIYELQELRKICKNKLIPQHPLIKEIDNKIEQYKFENDSNDLIKYDMCEAPDFLIQNFINYFSDDYCLSKSEKFVIDKIKYFWKVSKEKRSI